MSQRDERVTNDSDERVTNDSDETLRDTTSHDWLAGATLLWFAVGLAVFAGGPGLAAGLAVAGLWYVLGTPAAIAIGTVCIAAVLPTAEVVSLTLVTAPLVVLVAVSVLASPESSHLSQRVVRELRVSLVAVTASLVAIGGGGWLLVQVLPLWLGALAIVSAFAIAGYFVHRLLLFRLDLLDTDAPTRRDTHRSDASQ